MAKHVKKKISRTAKKTFASPFNIYWDKNNYYILLAGFAVIIIGFYLMSIGPWNSFTSLVLSPIFLIIGYVIIFPASILYRKRKKISQSDEDNKSDTSKS